MIPSVLVINDRGPCNGSLSRKRMVLSSSRLGRVLINRSGLVRFSNRPSGSSTFRLTTTPVSLSLTGSRFSSDFSYRPSGSSTFRLTTTPVSMSLTGSRFSSDSAPRPFHHGDSKTRWNNLSGGLAVNMTAGPSGQTISPHPSSREGHHSTARWSSISSYRI